MSDDAFLQKLRSDFLSSVDEDLDVWEADLLAYDQTGDEEKLADLKRLVHSMKSTTQSIALEEAGSLLHEFERWMLAALPVKPRSEFVSFGLKITDGLRSYLTALRLGEDSSRVANLLRESLRLSLA